MLTFLVAILAICFLGWIGIGAVVGYLLGGLFGGVIGAVIGFFLSAAAHYDD